MEYKLIVSDMDGTVLGSNHQITDENKKALYKAFEKGIKVIPASGRMYDSAREHFEFLDINTPLIACNGGIIKETKTGKVIYKNPIKYETCLELIDIFEKYDVYYQFYSEDTLFGKKMGAEYIEFAKERLKNFSTENIRIYFEENIREEIKKEDILKIIIIDNYDIENLQKIKEEISKIKDIEITSSWRNNIEIMNKGVNKGVALKFLLDYLNIDKDSVIAFGDNYNDIPMLNYAKTAVVMGNADDEVKEIADYVTDLNDNDGVAKGIYKFLDI